jgi:hypothetical protein
MAGGALELLYVPDTFFRGFVVAASAQNQDCVWAP